ncbi:uncharacterized protein B0J16DRAFT_388868 [Fusarium flagelliforme]|uniref:uncharacterized protein n=1 Tax=Fusarium flagelliforme TaxID=2675880 RepID=UPI001E8D8622|nr:uncharacterized protein B0J16DRAFT_388868 [Fusarium flagelliforme]KAH7175042.1 hypothetical protein B0J16DRAFT_388868 [Fusarium flagelliforme]
MQPEALLQLLSWVTGDLAAGTPHYCTKLAAIVDAKKKILALDQSIPAVIQCMACLEKLHEFMVMSYAAYNVLSPDNSELHRRQNLVYLPFVDWLNTLTLCRSDTDVLELLTEDLLDWDQELRGVKDGYVSYALYMEQRMPMSTFWGWSARKEMSRA